MNVTGLFTWLGGGQPTEVADRHERAGYAVTGAAVLLFATVTAVIAAVALAEAGSWPLLAIVAVALLGAALAGTVARALATRRPGREPDRLGMVARIGVAVLIGGVVAELAAVGLFAGTVERLLDDRAHRSAATAAAVVAASAELDRARADRASLDQSIGMAQADIDRALVTARCEYNPNPECPQTRITGVPGRGPETQTANNMLEDARQQLASAQNRIPALEQRITEHEQAVGAATSAATVAADRGFGARWQAMNDYTAHHADALPARVLTIVVCILLALLPLILHWWHGETSFDRRVAARAMQDRAERTADASIGVKRAEVRAKAESLRAEQQLAAARLAVEADTAIDRERQRTRVIAAIGGIEIGITEPPRRPELLAGPATDRKNSPVSDMTPNLPAPVTAAALTPASGALAPATSTSKGGGLELPLIGTVPFTETAARWIRPMVPSFVANAIDTATHPLRTARHAFEEVEEITFTLRRTRKVTVDTQDSPAPAVGTDGHQLPGSAHAHRVASAMVDANYPIPSDPRYSVPQADGYGLPAADTQDELTTRQHPELPGRFQRELPPGR